MDLEGEPIFFRNQVALREWFVENSDKTREAWIGYYKRSTGKESITWEESVEEAICFGWIDGIRKSIDDSSYKIRFTPRKPGSYWSLKNITTAERKIREGMMMPSGEKAFKRRNDEKSGIYSYEQEKAAFNKNYESIFRKNNKAWKYFSAEASYYRKIAIRWVMSAKQEKTRVSRLEILILDSENGVRIKPMRRDNA
jgi:uncharacterized protein YdeI (YjbR/CyaY-like superfamily)